MRYRLILGCAALTALGLAFGSSAGSTFDSDGDGVPDSLDNCLDGTNGAGVGFPNDPLISDSNGCGQFDVDGDGYGNACDADVSQNGVVSLEDVGVILAGLPPAPYNPLLDITCNNVVGLPDLGAVLSELGFEFDMGGGLSNRGGDSSGLPCAGTQFPPCLN